MAQPKKRTHGGQGPPEWEAKEREGGGQASVSTCSPAPRHRGSAQRDAECVCVQQTQGQFLHVGAGSLPGQHRASNWPSREGARRVDFLNTQRPLCKT